MNQKNKALLALDIGEKRIGVAGADGSVLIARPLGVIAVDGNEQSTIARYVKSENADAIIVGYPRNQSGEATAQTAYVEAFVDRLKMHIDVPIIFQDESLTSVMAEDHLRAGGKPYEKGDVDAQAAAIILQDYMEYADGRI